MKEFLPKIDNHIHKIVILNAEKHTLYYPVEKVPEQFSLTKIKKDKVIAYLGNLAELFIYKDDCLFYCLGEAQRAEIDGEKSVFPLNGTFVISENDLSRVRSSNNINTSS
jgi:hypothetical protein